MSHKVTSCHGAGLVSAVAGVVNSFTVFVQAGHPISGVSVAFEGPSKPEITFKDNKDNSVEVKYVPKVGGDYKIHCSYDDKPIKGSPFYLKVTGSPENTRRLVEKISCSGEALTQGKVGTVNEISVDCKDAGITGGLSIAMEGPSKPEVTFADNKDGTLKVKYKPQQSGKYRLHLKFGEFSVPGSPFTITVS
ncbi:Filamin-A [Fragariocoptes setiger]|uniref:Filamin-A n=1 Tax=Fragariocoptes setiger TaxID=1670756 RepID=A0ABQ7S7J9_9ACAR|nr:Filamin-A [Fragariocoptes setiger]